jgi:hypothetical protein
LLAWQKSGSCEVFPATWWRRAARIQAAFGSTGVHFDLLGRSIAFVAFYRGVGDTAAIITKRLHPRLKRLDDNRP